MLSSSKGCFLGLLLLLSVSAGCTMCSNCELNSYSAYGGRWNRTERTTGRVGSVFDPAGAQIPFSETAPVGSQLAPSETPANPDPANPDPANGAKISEAAYYE